jgi:hypothetical protein
MSRDPHGPESPAGDSSQSHQSAAAQDFLGLGEGADGAPGDLGLGEDPWTTSSPTIDGFDDPEPSVELDLYEELERGNGEHDALAFLDEPMRALLPNLTSAEAPESWGELPGELESSDDTFSLEFEDLDGGEVEIQESSWLMEFELEEDAEFGGLPVQLISRDPEAEFEPEFEEELEQELVGAGFRRSPWIRRGVLAALSVVGGMVGSWILSLFLVPASDSWDSEPRLAQPAQPGPSGTEVAVLPPVAQPVEIAEPPVAGPDPEPQTMGPQVSEAGPTPAETGPPAPDPGLERRTQELSVEDILLLADDSGSRLREASASELAGVWLGATIPLDALGGPSRLLTPNVGRVRVVLTIGEVFEGQLYAIGEKKVWIETELGKLALLDWQIDRIEHIVTSEGSVVVGPDGSKDLAGLKSVRVRTAGGVFYGKLLSREGASVTLVMASGARVTLDNAQVEAAGRSLSRLVDASGALADLETPE